jgi:uncharacterized damage-inducible protein DinB
MEVQHLNTQSLGKFRYNGARALVLLHEKYMMSCIDAWQEAKVKNVILPETDDQDYQSLNTLLRHILRASRGYMTWICDNLNLPDPAIEKVPEADIIVSNVQVYLTHLLEKWRIPLVEIPEERFHNPTYTSRWGVEYCIDAMLEHAVMHPIRHEYQLRNLIAQQLSD